MKSFKLIIYLLFSYVLANLLMARSLLQRDLKNKIHNFHQKNIDENMIQWELTDYFLKNMMITIHS